MERRHNFQTVAWFNDLLDRKRLDMDPPYQRRSVWNQRFKDYFIETVLLNYPSPAIFLYEEISPDGRSVSHVIDGKQRLTTIFEFVADQYPVSDSNPSTSLQGKFFSSLPDNVKRAFWSYQFLVEYVPKDDETLIDNIFERINRNVAKLTPQELRHAKYDGPFILTAEALSEWMTAQLPTNIPRMGSQSRKQMKDVELVAILLLHIEFGTNSYSQAELDQIYANYDETWDKKTDVENEFRSVITTLRDVFSSAELSSSRLRNQADFYSLFGAILSLTRERALPSTSDIIRPLSKFIFAVEKDENTNIHTREYYEAARSASSDKGPRETRIRIIKGVIQGTIQV